MTQDNSIVIREYLTTDKEVVMNLITLNTPNFFAKEEVNDLSNYLDKGIELYYVLLVDGKLCYQQPSPPCVWNICQNSTTAVCL